ncbi:MAG TPA: helix-hairpin-helix domain-containing protein [Burkholderiaceae bacterium]
MRRPLLLAALLLRCALACAGVDANQANEAELDGIKGIGPGLSARIMAARAQQPFKNWADLIRRVPGIGPTSAKRLSSQGLTVDNRPYPEAPVPQPAPQ